MESLPPMAATPRPIWRLVCTQQGGEGLAPAGGFVSEPSQSIPGGRDRRLEASPPAATSLATDSMTELRAPVKGLRSMR